MEVVNTSFASLYTLDFLLARLQSESFYTVFTIVSTINMRNKFN